MSILIETGFQKIWSQHQMTNNRIILPKLKRGFVISGLNVNDMAGALVQLTYLANPVRKKVMQFRVGKLKPDSQLKDLLKI
jgi:hypothetical protein